MCMQDREPSKGDGSVTTSNAVPTPAPLHELPKPGGYARASDSVRKLLNPDEARAWAFAPDDYLYAEVIAEKETFLKRHSKRAKVLTVSVIEGTEAADPITPSSLRCLPLVYAALEPLAEKATTGTKFGLHFQGKRGFAYQFRIAIEPADSSRPDDF